MSLNLAQQLQEMSDSHLTDLGPTIEFSTKTEGPDITITWESTNDGYAGIEVRLYDIQNDHEGAKVYDAEFIVSNSDNVGPKDMLAQLNRCIEQFYEMGLNKKFGHIIGDF